MDPIMEILALLALAELTDEQQARLTELYTGLTDEELAGLETSALARFDEIHGGDDITPEQFVELGNLADAIDGARAESGTRYEAAEVAAAAEAEAEAERQRTIDALVSRVRPPEPVASDDDGAEGGGDGGDPASTDDVVEPVAAAATTVPATRAAIQGRAPSRVQVRGEPRRATIRSVDGRDLASLPDLEDGLLSRWEDLDGTLSPGKHRVASFIADVPKERRLRDGRINDVTEIQDEIHARIHESGGGEALVADGGICSPVEFYYGVQTLGQAGRSLRGSLSTYVSNRGGIAFNQPMTLSNIKSATTPTAGNAIGVITEAQDRAATYNKSVQRVDCPTSTEVRTDAVYLQLEFGNFFDRTNPERKAQFTDLSATAYSRFSEQRLWNAMLGLSTTVDAPQSLGAVRDFLTAMNRWAIGYRGRHRMPIGAQLDVWIPAWVGMGLLPDDQVRALQSYPEQFDVNMAWVESKLRDRHIRVADWYEDDFTTAIQNSGGIPAYPSVFHVVGAHPGAFTLVDNGRLDIGVFRDSTLIADNLFRTFMEEFWNVAMWGVEADNIQFSLCANGASAGSVAPHCGS